MAAAAAVMLSDRIISLATRYRLPNVYSYRYCPESGDLASYGPDPLDSYRRAAAYVGRIFKGEGRALAMPRHCRPLL
jgi:putative ABC transport system substrate-binding protein